MNEKVALADEVYDALRTIFPNLPPKETGHVKSVVVFCEAGKVPYISLHQWIEIGGQVGEHVKVQRFTLVPEEK